MAEEIKGESKVTEMLEELKSAVKDHKKSVEDKLSVLGEFREAMDKQKSEAKEELDRMKKAQEKAEADLIELTKKLEKKAPQGEEAKKFKGLGDFVYKAMVAHAEDADEFKISRGSKNLRVKALSGESGEDGGYLIPDEFSEQIDKLTLGSSIVRANGAVVIPMARRTYERPYAKNFNQKDGYQYGGMTGYWLGENTAITESQPEFGTFKLVANKLAGLTLAPNELTEDAVSSFGQELQAEWAEVLTWKEDDAFINGDGVGKPLGVVNADATIEVSRDTASHVYAEDIIEMYSRFYSEDGVWLINKDATVDILKMTDDNSNWIFFGSHTQGITGNVPLNLLGMPIRWTDKASALGSTGDVQLHDFRHYRIGDRKAISIEVSRDRYFEYDQTAWRIVKRLDGKPWLPSAITPARGTNTLSPFVVLK